MTEIKIGNLWEERRFTEYQRRRGELRDALRFGVFPNLVRALHLYEKFVADYGPDGPLYDESIWAYYQANIEPIAAQQSNMIDAAQEIVLIMQAVETVAPGTFEISVPST